MSLDARHEYICSVMAMKLGVEASEVEEYLLEGDQVCSITNAPRALSDPRYTPT